MNLPAKACLGAGAFLVLSGGLLALSGFLMGGSAPLRETGGGAAADEVASTPVGESSQTLSPFSTLDVDLARGSVLVIASGEDYEISVTGRLAGEINYVLQGDTLTVAGGGEDLEFFSSGDEALVTVTVPEGAYLERVDLNADMGQVEAEGFTAASLGVTVDLGSVDLTGVTAGEASFTLGMGDLNGYDLTTRSALTVVSDMGDVTLDGAFRGTTEVTLSMGDLEITAAQPLAGCALDLSTALGDVWLDGEAQGRSCRRQGDGDAITVSSSMGEVSVMFTEAE